MNDPLDYLAAVLAQEIIAHIYGNRAKCDCETCCPKPPLQPDIPDSADLIHSVLKRNGLNNLTPSPVQPPSNTVTIFEGPYAGRFGIICQEELCSCCVFVKTIHEVVKVSRKHCNIHR